MDMPKILIGLILFSGACCILFEYWGPRWLFYTFKPLTMVLIIFIPILGTNEPTAYQIWIIVGLVSALVGDVLLMLPTDRFLAGVLTFLGTHICYILAFSYQLKELVWIPLLPLVLIGSLFIVIMGRTLREYRDPIYVYVVIIALMIWMAWERWLSIPGFGSRLALIGAGLFAVSDFVLVFDKFKKRIMIAPGLTLGLYFTAQLLIASSVLY